jgi:ubiquinone/menaquinone biosynthesis C-methylase UbiE
MASIPKEFEELGRSFADAPLASFRANKGRADKAIAQLPDEKLHVALDSNNRQDEQRRLIVEQFTKQAVRFSQMPHHNGEDTNRLVIETAGIGRDDTVLDVACGPGLITCAVTGVARHVTGIDITPAMIGEARKRQQAMGLTNMTWKVGDVLPRPFPGSSFSVVITR